MNPAFSVIFFTTLSGLGYGLWIWTAIALLLGRSAHSGELHLFALTAGVVPVCLGLLSSTLHLGKPLRAWRAFSQWRSSWLSREGVLAILAFLPWLGFAAMRLPDSGDWSRAMPWLAAALLLLSLATVFCTAMIYASLKPVPAWSHRAVVPAYLGFSVLTGGLAASAWQAAQEWPGDLAVLLLLLLAVLMAVIKRRYWRDIDCGAMPVSRASALGLGRERGVQVFERPHTEANYLTTEMGFVLARKHSRRLRAGALLLFAAVPIAACAATLLWPPAAMPALALAALTAMLGAMMERWLFFAEARHVVMTYY